MINLPEHVMRCTERVIELSRVDSGDDTYRITTNTSIDDLVESLHNVGLIAPPVLIEKNSEYAIICGFRRIAACRHLKWPHIRARVLDSDTTPLECATVAITDNAFQRSLNLIEKSRSYSILSRFYPDDTSLSKASALLSLNDNPSVISKVKKMSMLSDAIQTGILSGNISLTIALELGNLEQEAGEGFLDLFSGLRLSLNKQKEMLTLVKEIAILENISIPDVLQTSDFQSILHREDFDRTQKTRNVRFYLRQRRFPSITRIEKAFNDHLNKLKLGKKAKLIPPENFEGTEYVLNLIFRNLKELTTHRETLDKLIKNPDFKKILNRME